MKLESSAAPLTIATMMLHMRNAVSLRAHTVDATTGITEDCAKAVGQAANKIRGPLAVFAWLRF